MKIRNSPPCKDCPDRPADRGCGNHANCERFSAWQDEWAKKKETIYGEKDRLRILDEFTTDSTRRIVRSLGRK